MLVTNNNCLIDKEGTSFLPENLPATPVANVQYEELEYKLIKRFCSMQNKEKTLNAVNIFLRAIERATIKKQIRKTGKNAALIKEIQKKLIKLHHIISDSKADSVRVEIDQVFLKKCEKVIKRQATIKDPYKAAGKKRKAEKPVKSVGRPRSPKKVKAPAYDILVGKTRASDQFGILGKSEQGKKIALDLNETNTISLFGVQGGGKSYSIGTISEMVLKKIPGINQLPAPLASVIFHFSESMDYEPEFTSMILANDKDAELAKLKKLYGAEPTNLDDVILLTPADKVAERQAEFPSIQVKPIAFNPQELIVQDWMFLLGAIGNDSAYIKQLKTIMKQHRRNISFSRISESVEESELLSKSQKSLAKQKLSFAKEYLCDSFYLKDILKPGRLIIVDLRDEFIIKDEALGLFVIMLNIFSSVKKYNEKRFNKLIVFDEAHKYMDNKDLTSHIVTAIREMRHKGVNILIASQDPPSLPNEIIELSSILLMHKFNSPQWLKHIQKSVTQLSSVTSAEMSALKPGEGFLWATKATDKSVSNKPVKIQTRPRATKHGGGTLTAV
jgi:DNA phosphorothioation-dependent restriction protein DptH